VAFPVVSCASRAPQVANAFRPKGPPKRTKPPVIRRLERKRWALLDSNI
jgi:hypothetical protein